MKKKVKFHIKYYGVIDSIENDLITARLYTQNTNELSDVIQFSTKLLNTKDKEHLVLNAVFSWTGGYIGKKPFSTFRLLRRTTPRVPALTHEEACELSAIFNNRDVSTETWSCPE